nr:reverse transcriptase domain-containing protein [Tanacetum cinerariifolium]
MKIPDITKNFHSPLTKENDTRVDYLLFFSKNNLYDTLLTCIDMEVDVEVDVEDEVEDEVESSDTGTMEVGVDVVVEIDIPDGMLIPDVVECLEQAGQRELEARSLIAGKERASLLDQVTSLERSNVRLRGTMMMERARADRFRRCVSFIESELRTLLSLVLVTCAANALEAENQSQNGSDGDNGNGGDGNGGNGNPNEDNRGARHVARECTYQDFMKCQPLNFKGTKGVVGLIRNNDLAAYTQIFQELTMMCTKMVPEEEDRVEKFIGGLSDNIQRNVIAAEPIRLQDAVRIANNLLDQKLKGRFPTFERGLVSEILIVADYQLILDDVSRFGLA